MNISLNIGFLGASPGPFEIIIILGAVLLLFGAKGIPQFARSMGKMMVELRKASDEFKGHIMDVQDSVEHEMKDLNESVKELTVSIEDEDLRALDEGNDYNYDSLPAECDTPPIEPDPSPSDET